MKYAASTTGFTVIFAIIIFSAIAFGQGDAKLKADEIISKHIASIGTPEAIKAAANRKIEGTAQARVPQKTTMTVQGLSLLGTSGDKFKLAMAFQKDNVDDYGGEQISFDGSKLDIPFVSADSRSAIGAFVFLYPEIAKKGLLGGPLLSMWALLDAGNKVGKMEPSGKETINGIETYKVKYTPKGGSSLNIKMYFDASNFRLVRTEYKRTLTAGVVQADEGRVTEDRYTLIEDYSDYKVVNGLTLPMTYRIDFIVDTYRKGREFEWTLKFNRVSFGQEFAADAFQ